MKRFIAAAAIACAVQSHAQADEARYERLGECIAYFAISGGVDGTSPVDPETAARISAIGEEFMFEASVLGRSDDAAQTFVVERLEEQNAILREEGRGMRELDLFHEDGCLDIAAELGL